jgi:iron complex transport system substrate-binding protein
MMKRPLLTILIAFLLGACGARGLGLEHDRPQPSSDSTQCHTLQHLSGKTKICGKPQRIIALGPNALETLLDLGIQPMAFADHVIYRRGDYTHPEQQIPYLGRYIPQPLVNLGDSYMPSIEKILRMQPDLIVGHEGSGGSQYQILSQITPTIILKWDAAEANLRTIARVFNRSREAEERLSEKSRNIEVARREFSKVVANSPNLLLLSLTGLEQISFGNQGHGRCGSLLQNLGFQLVDLPENKISQSEAIVPISLENLPDFNHADHILLLGSDFSPLGSNTSFEDHHLAHVKRAWRENIIAQKLTASKKGRVYFIPAYLCLGLPGSIGTKLYLAELKKQILNR